MKNVSTSDVRTEIIPVIGMHCASCAQNISRVLKKVPGVHDANASYATEKVKVTFDRKMVTEDDLNARISTIGYRLAIPDKHDDMSGHPMMSQKIISEAESVRSVDMHREHIRIDTAQETQKIGNTVSFTTPMAFFIFLAMMWETVGRFFPYLPPFPIPMRMWTGIQFIISSIFLFLFGGQFTGAVVRFARYRTANMDTLIGLGTTTAYLYSSFLFIFPVFASQSGLPDTLYFDVTIVVIGFILLGKYLEASSKRKTGEALEKLMKMSAKTALVIRDGKESELPVEDVRIGDIFVVKPGSTVPVDGTVISGTSSIDESMLSGEPLPVDVSNGSSVTGGTLNIQGVLRCSATRIGSETVLARITAMVEEAQNSKAPIERLADTVSGIFVPVVLVTALVSGFVWLMVGSGTFALTAFIGILVIACPCALGLATPTAVIAGVGRGAGLGILIKDAESLEKLHSVNTVVMDKTGTLTMGKPVITDIVPVSGTSESDIRNFMTIFSALEHHSEHPLARAVSVWADAHGITPNTMDHVKIHQGMGIEGVMNKIRYMAGSVPFMKKKGFTIDEQKIENLTAEGKTPIILSGNGKVLGMAAISDQLKPEAAATVQQLRSIGVEVVMLSGDNPRTAEYIGNLAGIRRIIAGVMPDGKAGHIKKLQAEGKIVTMVGDGVNDAPAIAQADVGIAMSTGTDAAITTANITLLHGDIRKVLTAIRLSKATLRIVKQNLFWAFAYNVIGIPLAAGIFYPIFGILLNPAYAGVAMALSSVSVVTNSLRLKRIQI